MRRHDIIFSKGVSRKKEYKPNKKTEIEREEGTVDEHENTSDRQDEEDVMHA